MKKNILRIIGFSFAVFALLLALAGMFGFIDMTSILYGASGISLAMAPAAAVSSETVTTTVTAAKSSELLINTIDKKITLIQPDLYPLDTIMRNNGIVVPVSSWKTEFYAVEARGFADTIKTTKAIVTGNQAAWYGHTIKVNNIHIWQVDDILFVKSIVGADGFGLAFQIIAKDNVDSLTCFVLNGGGTNLSDTAEIVSTTPVYRIGNAKEELAAQTTPYAVFPQKSYNYSQVHMAQVEQGLYDKLHDKEVLFGMSDLRNQALWDLRARTEFTSLVGVKRYGYDATAGKFKYFSGGVIREITKSVEWDPAALDNPAFYSWTKTIFTGNNGSASRVLFAGGNLMEALGSIPAYSKQIEAKKTEVRWGVKFNAIETSFGELLVKYHSGLDQIGYNDNGVVLDMNNIEKHVFKSMETKSLDLITSGQRKADAQVIDEAFCLAVKNPDTHCMVNKVAPQ